MTDLYSATFEQKLEHFNALEQRLKDAFQEFGWDTGTLGKTYYHLKSLLQGASLVAPYKPGDRVELAVTPEITAEKSWGWMGSKHFLVEGAKAVVHSVDLDKYGWTLNLYFDDESWIGYDDKVHRVSEHSRHLYSFNACKVRKTL